MDYIKKDFWDIIDASYHFDNNTHQLLPKYKFLSNPFKNDDYIIYHVEGLIHRNEDLGPAIIDLSIPKYPNRITYLKNGRIHRLKGPADIDPSIYMSIYYINSEEFSKEEWEIKRLKYLNVENF